MLAAVWIINGLYAKLLVGVPRHQAIVARFFGATHARSLTVAVGCAELIMAAWILSGVDRGACLAVQAIVIFAMNGLELWRARDLLLFPRLMPMANVLYLLLGVWWCRR